MIRQQDIDRFWNKIKQQDGCWEFNSATDRDGYHKFNYKLVNSDRWIQTGAHRFVLMALGKTIPQGNVVCHRCDNPSCVNPSHLFIGTVNDNNQDKVKKGRQPSLKGSKNGSSKLNETIVKQIRKETIVGNRSGYNNGSNVKEIAKKYNVHSETVRLIAKRKIWNHI